MRNICVLPNKQFVTNKFRAISNLGTRRFVFCVKLLDCLLAQIYLLIWTRAISKFGKASYSLYNSGRQFQILRARLLARVLRYRTR